MVNRCSVMALAMRQSTRWHESLSIPRTNGSTSRSVNSDRKNACEDRYSGPFDGVQRPVLLGDLRGLMGI